MRRVLSEQSQADVKAAIAKRLKYGYGSGFDSVEAAISARTLSGRLM